jgi:Suppressor of fused protein (SUFU)
MSATGSELIGHLESTLGQIDSGWRHEESGSGIAIVRTRDQPYDGASTYVTLGVCRHVFKMDTGRDVRQEFIVSADDRFESTHVASFLQTFAEFVAARHQALLRGEVIGPSEPVIPGIRLNAIYTAIPVLHDERLRTFDGTRPPTVFAWIVPIHGEEADYVRERGWEAFEERLEAAEADLCDLERDSVV